MKTLQTLVIAASIMLTATAQAGPTKPTPGPFPGPIYTVAQCGDLSRRIDLAWSAYNQSVAISDATQAMHDYEAYLQLNSEYDINCIGISHTY
ncbi:MAG: hypothetical protein MJK04_07460 [Psychrosphaera sp.]|nr:hypothetical protein [Psychrosphaera sp.]